MRASWVFAGLLFVALAPARGDSIDDASLSSYGGPANVINLFTNGGTFGPATFISVPGWITSIGPGGSSLELHSVDGSAASPQWLQDFTTAGPGVTTIDFAWQSTIWDYGTNSAGTIVYGAHQASTGSPFPSQLAPPSTTPSAAYFAAGGPAAFVAPVPEPSSVLIAGLGLGLLGLRRRLRAARPALVEPD